MRFTADAMMSNDHAWTKLTDFWVVRPACYAILLPREIDIIQMRGYLSAVLHGGGV